MKLLLWLSLLTLAATVYAAKDIREPYTPLSDNAWTPSPELGFHNHGLKYEMQIHDSYVIAFEVINGTFRVAIAVNATGWIGFGPSATGSMIGANPCVVQEMPIGSGQMIATSMHSDVAGTPLVNEFQNCHVIEYNRLATESYVLIERPIVGCKPDDQDISDLYEQRFVAAWGSSQTFTYHGTAQRTTVFMNAFTGPPPQFTLPDDALPYDALLKGPWEIPADLRDVYVCRGHRFPSDRRYHVIRLDPVLFDIYPAYYHHVILYGCPSGLPPSWHDGENQYCPGSGGVTGCRQFVTGWATGQLSLYYYPAGLPIGAGGDNACVDFVIENHIDHPDMTGGIIDGGWGLRLWYTPTLYDLEAGTVGIYVGIPGAGIPPQSVDYFLHGDCGPACTQGNIPPEGIIVQSISPHSHSAGKGSYMKVVRTNGQEVDLHTQTHWDAAWQGPHILVQELRIYPGDRIIAMCHYDTTDRDVPTYFGEGYGDEMCTPYISYYPRMPMSICSEWPGYLPEDGDRSGLSYCDAFPYVAPITNRSYDPAPPPPNWCGVRQN